MPGRADALHSYIRLLPLLSAESFVGLDSHRLMLSPIERLSIRLTTACTGPLWYWDAGRSNATHCPHVIMATVHVQDPVIRAFLEKLF